MEKQFNSYSSPITNKKGVTLIEVLVAIVILTVGLTSVAMMQYMAVAGNAFGRETQIASELGQELLEKMRSTPVRDDTGTVNSIFVAGTHPTPEDDTILQNPVGSGDADYDPVTRAGGMTFTRIWWVEDDCRSVDINDPIPTALLCTPAPPGACAGGAGMNNVKALAVRVCWTDKNGSNHTVTLNGVKWDETATP
ncbi:MAG: type IV pilus modification protein PilV [Nitrospirota bacterium]|nr:type IV pilus modification protein PilV [Nitrospirota bacterium]